MTKQLQRLLSEKERNRINMFVKKPFEGMDAGMKAEILREANERLESVLHVDGEWIIDYVRIRIRARKVSECPKR